ncbi:MAG TPA: hypothetical protein VGH57_37130, partial [Amycolatopsis sp.]
MSFIDATGVLRPIAISPDATFPSGSTPAIGHPSSICSVAALPSGASLAVVHPSGGPITFAIRGASARIGSTGHVCADDPAVADFVDDVGSSSLLRGVRDVHD